MKTSLKKLTSVFLAVLLVLSVFSVMGVAAADTNKATTGDTVIHVTDNLGWGTMYVHYWGGSSESTWPGVQMNDEGDNGYGSHNFSASVPDDATGYVFTKGADGPQTVDVHDVNVEGYWLDGTQTDGKYNVRLWGDTGDNPGGGGDNPGGGGDNPGGGGYNPGPGSGPHTVVLDASAVDTGYVDWRAWTWSDGNEGYWVGAEGTTAADITYTGLEDNVVFAYFTAGSDDGWGGKIGQTDDLRVEGSTFTVYSANPGDAGSVVGEWSGDGPGPEPEPEPGDNTVYLNPGDVSGSWYAWSYDGGESGSWVSSEDAGDGVLKFSGVSSQVIFVNTSDGDWSGRVGQTGDADSYVTDGMMFTITGETEGDDGYGNPITSYIGEWGPYGGGGEETQPDSEETQPDSQETQPDSEETQPSSGDVPTQPESEETQPETQAEQVVPGQGLDITTSLNKVTTGQINAKKDAKVKVTFNMQAPMLLEDGQGTLYYDSNKLKLESFDLPNVDAGLTINDELPNEAKFNFMGVDSKTKSGKTDFKDSKAFVVAEFTVVAEGSTTVNLDIEELDGFENNESVAYYTFGVASSAAASITESLSKPSVVVEGGDEPQTQPSSSGGGDEPTQPSSGDITPTQPSSGGGDVTPTQAPPVGTKQYKYIPKTDDVLSGKNFKITIQDTNGQFHIYEMKPTGETVDGQPVYAADVPTNITPSVINYQTFQGDTFISQVTKSASEVGDGIVKYDGTIAGQTPAVTQPSSTSKPATKVTKKANPIKVKAKTVKVKASKLKKKAQKIKISKLLKVTKAQGTKTYYKVKKGSTKAIYKKIKINKKTGKITLKKGKYKKKTYKIKIKVKAAGNSKYKAKTVTKVAKIKIK